MRFLFILAFLVGCTTQGPIVAEEVGIEEDSVDVSLYVLPKEDVIRVEFVIRGVGTAEVRVDSMKVTVYE